MNWNKLADDLLGMLEATAPLVGLSDEVEAAKKVLESAKGAYSTIKDALDPSKAAQVEAGLGAFADRVNAHAERTKDSLG